MQIQKKIIALAIASALTAPALALAEASVSGQVNMSYAMRNDGNTNSSTTNQLNSDQSRLIIKGNEDLGSGLSAIAQLDARFTVDNGVDTAAQASTPVSNRFFDGNNYLGLKSDSMGTVMAGRMDSPYKTSTRNLDLFFDVTGDNRSGVGAVGGLLTNDSRFDNMLAYNSPNMGGFSVSAAAGFGAETALANTTKGSLYALAGMYNANNIYATLAYQTKKIGSALTGDLGVGGASAGTGALDSEAKALKVGGGFSTDMFTANLVVERATTKANATAADVSRTNFYLAGKFNVSSTDSVRAAYTKRGATTGVTNDANQYAIGYEHGMSKATSVYASYVKTTDNTINIADPSALVLGMKHSF